MKKYYLGLEERYSMSGNLLSTIYLLTERTVLAQQNRILERMSVATQYGYFEADIEFHFDQALKFQVISKADGKQIGTGTCIGPYDSPKAMMDTVIIQQTKEKATAVFSFDGPRIFVAKIYYSLDSSEQIGFSTEKLLEIQSEKYNFLRNKADEITVGAKELRFDQ